MPDPIGVVTVAARLRKLEAQASEAPWFVVGPPWNPSGAPWLNAGSADPHGGTFVCDLDSPDDNHSPEEWERVEADAALIASARNLLPLLADGVEALEDAADTFADFERALHWLGRPTLAEAAQVAMKGCLAALARVADQLDHEEGTT